VEKNPNFWCLIDENKCGVSLHFVNEDIDSGKIVAQKEIKTSWEDTGKTIYEKSLKEIINLFTENFEDILENKIQKISQPTNEGTFHLAKEMNDIIEIDLEKEYTAKNLFNIVRAKMFSPYPPTFFYDNGKKYSVEIKIKEVNDDE